MIKRILKKLSLLARRKLRVVGVNIPIVFFLMAGLSILPIGMAFGEGDTEPSGKDLSNEIEIYDVEFHKAGSEDLSPIPNLEYPDGTTIENGDFWLSFNWRLTDPDGEVAYGDYFDVTVDLGLESIAAEISQQRETTVAPIIYLADNTVAGSIRWINMTDYETQKRIIIRIELDEPGFGGIQGSEDDPVRGRGVWGFQYKVTEETTGAVYWQISVGESEDPVGGIIVKPKPDNPNVSKGGNQNHNPYDEFESGYKKVGGRLTPNTTPFADTLFYWSVQINGHKHSTIEEWKNCENNTDDNPYNDDPPPVPIGEDGSFPATFTIVDTGRNTAPTWLREVTKSGSNPLVHPETAIQVDRNGGLYGQSLGETGGPAYLKLFYVNSDHIWNDRINYQGTPYATPANDTHPKHKPPYGDKVGAYDPYFTTWYLKEGERSSLMYAPNGSEPGGEYEGYLTPVPPSDIVAIRITQKGFEIEMVTSAVLGKTLAIGCMAKPATDESGDYNNEVGNSVAIKGVNDGNPVTSVSANVLIAGTIEGGRLSSPNRGSFVIDKRDYNTADRMEGVAFSVTASSENAELAQKANELIQSQMNMNSPPALLTGSDGRLAIKLPDLPWGGDKNLILTITETAPEEHFAVKTFTVEIEPENGTVVSLTPGQGESHLVKLAPDRYGVEVWNRSKIKDMSVYDAALLKWVKKVDRVTEDGIVTVYYKDEVNEDVVSVKNGDIILFRVDVYNHCYNPLTITEIIDELPVGLVFEEDLTIAHIDPEMAAYTNKGLWELLPDDGTGIVKIKYVGPPINLEAWSGEIGKYPEGRLPLVLKVDVPESIPDGTKIVNFAKIKQMLDTDGEDVTDRDPTPENNEDDSAVVPYNGRFVSCEVDKDTIRRTSAAYVSPPGSEGFDNIEDNETYRYDVNFRSTSNISADEFVLDDPLECVSEGLVRLEMLVTPLVWGDEDGKYNLWYKTNKTKEGRLNDDTKAVAEGVTQMWNNEGYELWKKDLRTTQRYKLMVSELELGEDEYLTGLRFEYGAVKVGFTSKNYKSKSQNGKHRAASGALVLPAGDLAKLDDLSTKGVKPSPAIVTAAAASETGSAAQSGGNAFKNFFAGLFGSGSSGGEPSENTQAPEAAAFGTGGPYEPVEPGDYIDWTPDPSRPDYSAGAAEALGLAPISYLVSAVKPMSDEHIVTSAAARIAKGDYWDEDIDAVVTLQLNTFSLSAEEGLGLNQVSFFNDDIPKLSPDTLESAAIGRSARTFDEMKPLLFVVTAIASAFGIMLLLRFYNMRKKRVLLAQKRGGQAG